MGDAKKQEAILDGKDSGYHGDEKSTSNHGYDMNIKLKVARTLLMVSAWICMGLYSEISGPTLPYLKHRVDSDYEQISRVLAARSIGFLIGSIAGGVLCEKQSSRLDLWMFLSLAFAAIGTAIVPWCRHLGMLALMCSLDGLGKGILAAGGNSFILKLWGDQASVPCHSLHFSFGIGALIAPQIARPFLPSEVVVNSTVEQVVELLNCSTACSAVGFVNQTMFLNDRIEYPYGIIAVLTLLCGLCFLGMFFIFKLEAPPGSKPLEWRQMISAKSCINVSPNQLWNMVFVLHLFVLFAIPIGAERAYGKFLFAFALDSPVAFAPGDGTTLETVFWSTFTAGRGIATVVSRWVPPAQMIIFELAVALGSSLLLAIVGHSSPIALWLGTAVFAAVLSPIFPSVLIWANLHLNLTAMATSMAFLASAAGAFIFQWLAGYLFQYEGTRSLMYLMLSMAISESLVYLVTWLLSKRVTRHPASEQDKHGPLSDSLLNVKTESDDKDTDGDQRSPIYKPPVDNVEL